jgi:hypothetical protein
MLQLACISEKHTIAAGYLSKSLKLVLCAVAGIPTWGPKAKAAQLEGSKVFMKAGDMSCSCHAVFLPVKDIRRLAEAGRPQQSRNMTWGVVHDVYAGHLQEVPHPHCSL